MVFPSTVKAFFLFCAVFMVRFYLRNYPTILAIKIRGSVQITAKDCSLVSNNANITDPSRESNTKSQTTVQLYNIV